MEITVSLLDIQYDGVTRTTVLYWRLFWERKGIYVLLSPSWYTTYTYSVHPSDVNASSKMGRQAVSTLPTGVLSFLYLIQWQIPFSERWNWFSSVPCFLVNLPNWYVGITAESRGLTQYSHTHVTGTMCICPVTSLLASSVPKPSKGAQGGYKSNGQGTNQSQRYRKPVRNNPCYFCSGPHWSDDCTEYTTIQSRMQRGKDRCFKCMRKGHPSRNCPTPKMCVESSILNWSSESFV